PTIITLIKASVDHKRTRLFRNLDFLRILTRYLSQKLLIQIEDNVVKTLQCLADKGWIKPRPWFRSYIQDDSAKLNQLAETWFREDLFDRGFHSDPPQVAASIANLVRRMSGTRE